MRNLLKAGPPLMLLPLPSAMLAFCAPVGSAVDLRAGKSLPSESMQ